MKSLWAKIAIVLVVVAAGPLAGVSASSGASVSSGPDVTNPDRTGPKLVSYNDRHGQVWVANVEGGSRRRLGLGESTLISPSGKYVAVSEPSGMKLYSTSHGSSHTFSQGEEVELLAWSDDSRYLAVSLTRPDFSGGGLTVIDTKTMNAKSVAKGIIRGASFRPTAPDRLVFSSAASDKSNAAVNLDTINPGGSDRRALTSDGRSLNPVWGTAGIAFDRQRFRRIGGGEEAGAQIWLLNNAGRRRQLTRVGLGEFAYGLVPVGFDHADNRLLAEYVQQDDPQAWIVPVPSGQPHQIKVTGQPITFGAGISSDGKRVLMTIDAFKGDAVATVAAAGGTAKVLIKGGEDPSWNE